MNSMNILLIGLPKSGKTTLLKTILENYPKKTGFFTNEIREDNIRTGFEIETSKWDKRLFASITFNLLQKIGKYWVDISILEKALPSISHFLVRRYSFYRWNRSNGTYFLILLKIFCINYLNSSNLCIATSQLSVNDFTEAIHQWSDTIIFEITPENREIENDWKLFIQ